jgi:hypothetical protein
MGTLIAHQLTDEPSRGKAPSPRVMTFQSLLLAPAPLRETALAWLEAMCHSILESNRLKVKRLEIASNPAPQGCFPPAGDQLKWERIGRTAEQLSGRRGSSCPSGTHNLK